MNTQILTKTVDGTQQPVCTKDLLTLAVELGITMLESGAEIFRIEESIKRIMTAYDVEHFDVYVLSNGIFATADEDTVDHSSVVRHMPRYSVNLSRIAQLNHLCRQFCDHRIGFEETWEKLKQIRTAPLYPGWLLTLASGIGAGCFCYLFGGSPLESVIAFIIGMAEELLWLSMSKARFSRSIAQVFLSMFATAASLISTDFLSRFFYLNRDLVIIGSLMVLVPGIVFTTSIRDFYNGDYLSGSIYLLDALLTALCIAAGVIIAFALLRLVGGEAFL